MAIPILKAPLDTAKDSRVVTRATSLPVQVLAKYIIAAHLQTKAVAII